MNERMNEWIMNEWRKLKKKIIQITTTTLWMNEWMNEWMKEWVNEWMNDWMNKQRKKWIKKKRMSEQPKSEWMNECPNQWQKQPQQPLIWWGGGGGANFPTSDNLQIFFGAFYHELVCISLELKGSDDFKSGTCVLLSRVPPLSKDVCVIRKENQVEAPACSSHVA